MSTYSLRPLQRRSDFKDVYKIFVPPKLYMSLRSGAKDLWILENAGNAIAMGKLSQAPDEVQNKVLQVSQEFKDLFGLSFSESYILRRSDFKPQNATEIVLQEQVNDLSPRQPVLWEGFLLATLADRMISPGLVIEDIQIGDEVRSFQVKTVRHEGAEEAMRTPLDFCVSTVKSSFQIEGLDDKESKVSSFSVDRSGLFGIDRQLDALDYVLSSHDSADDFYMPVANNGLLLLGPHGSGKTLVINRVAGLQWSKKVTITSESLGNSVSKVVDQVFSSCLKCQPALIIIKDLENLSISSGSHFESAIHEAFITINNAKVLVLAEAKSDTVPQWLLDCFKTRIYITPMDQDSRKDLIEHALNKYKAYLQFPVQLPTIIAEVTPGYTGMDLQDLVEEALLKARARIRTRKNHEYTTTIVDSHSDKAEQQTHTDRVVTRQDFEEARKSIFSASPRRAKPDVRKVVRWSDIGGQEEIKKTVEKCVGWPLKYPENYKGFGLRPSKGMLLYGPPGCSKTMIALAVANEAKLNFIPIKGPELLTKFVGDSEAKLRNIFERARSVAPCVIFFDEIDSINSDGGSGGGVKLIETLLNEVDGVDEAGKVFVLAATNKPWELDRALLRQGRFDTLLYVKLPDANTRREILKLKTHTIPHEELDLDLLVQATEGCSGAEIEGFCNSAKLEALEEQIDIPGTTLAARHFDKALASLRRDTSLETINMYEAFERKNDG